MARVYISIGSNIDRERYITAALDALAGWFDEPLISSVYESESVGFDGSPFYNLVVGVDTDLSVADLSARFKQLEADNGRRRGVPKFSPRTLDLDILTYDHEVGRVDGVELPRGEILKNAFVLLPLAKLRRPPFIRSAASVTRHCGRPMTVTRNCGRWTLPGGAGASRRPLPDKGTLRPVM